MRDVDASAASARAPRPHASSPLAGTGAARARVSDTKHRRRSLLVWVRYLREYYDYIVQLSPRARHYDFEFTGKLAVDLSRLLETFHTASGAMHMAWHAQWQWPGTAGALASQLAPR